jgi:type IV pilus assembly protein PilQ
LNNNINTQAGASYLSPAAGATSQQTAFGVTAGDFVNMPAAAQNGYNAASFAVSLFNASLTRVLNLEISAMEADGKGKIISSPRIVTTDQVKALIEQGTELPYEEKSASGATTTAFRKANLKLEVTPQITPEGNIILNLDINKDSVGRLTTKGFAIDTKHVQTQVLVENGGTVSIGGIFEEIERTDDTKVPVFGDLPGLGWLFRNRSSSRSKSEMMVFITPKLLDQAATAP